jgi:hypothetical protein
MITLSVPGLAKVGSPITTRKLFERQRHRVHRQREVRQLDECEQEGRNPEDVVVSEEREQRQNSDELKLHLVGPVRHVLGEGVEPEIDQADGDDGDNQKGQHHGHQPV